MVAARSDGLLGPALAGCLLGAASVVGVSALSGLVELDAVVGEALGAPAGGRVAAARVQEAATAPPPYTVDPDAVASALAAGAGSGRADGEAASAGAAGAIDAVRRHRKARSPRPAAAPARPDDARQVQAARVSPPSVTLVLERNRRGRLVTVQVIDPSRTSRTLLPHRRAGAPTKPTAGPAQAAGSDAAKSAGSDAAKTWRRGTVATP